MKVGVLIPSNNRRALFQYVIASIEHLKGLENNFHFLLNLNGTDWTHGAAEEAKCDFIKAGFFCEYIRQFDYQLDVNRTGKQPSMALLRGQCADLLPDCEAYVLADDNFEFRGGTKQYPRSSGERYLEVIQYMEEHKRCGVVMCEGSLGGTPAQFSIAPTRNGLIATTRGLFIRNVRKCVDGNVLFTQHERSLQGGLEETVAAYGAIEQGYFPAKQFNNPTLHREKTKIDENSKGIHSLSLIKLNAQQYIRDHFLDGRWEHESRKFPHQLYKRYETNCGPPSAFNTHAAAPAGYTMKFKQ